MTRRGRPPPPPPPLPPQGANASSSPRDAPNDPTTTAFLGGAIEARQQADGYRASLDTVLLGAAVGALTGDQALELGCGSGVALMIAAHHAPGASFVGVERDAGLVALASENLSRNAMTARARVVCACVSQAAPDRRERFDHVFFNPPFYPDAEAVRVPRDPRRAAAFIHDGPGLAEWLLAALRSSRSRGHITLIHRADRLRAILAVLEGRAGDIRVRPIAPHAGAPAKRILVRARKASRSPCTLLAPLVLHHSDGALTPHAAAVVEGRAQISFAPDNPDPVQAAAPA